MSEQNTQAVDLDALCSRGLGLHQAGRLDEARQHYEAVLAVDPGRYDALHLLGVFCAQTGRLEIAAELIGRAIAIRPDAAPAYGNLANALNGLGRPEAALAACDRAI